MHIIKCKIQCKIQCMKYNAVQKLNIGWGGSNKMHISKVKSTMDTLQCIEFNSDKNVLIFKFQIQCTVLTISRNHTKFAMPRELFGSSIDIIKVFLLL